jgi:tRNA(adenine34) deaminase
MQLALAAADAAERAGEVPVGAVLMRHGEVLATGRNQPIQRQDPTAHAEVVALRSGADAMGNYRLPDCDLYVTLEPCAMCVGAILHARLRRVVFGAADPKTGACGGAIDLTSVRFNHQTVFAGGLLAEECGALLRRFFAERRRAERSRID